MINLFCFAFGISIAFASGAEEFPGTTDTWNGYTRHNFEYDTRACMVIEPALAADGRPWIWRARFFGHEPQTDLSLLSRGFHLVYMDVADLYGNEAAVQHWNVFYEYLTSDHDFHPKPALEGMSRGGLIIYNWAKANPDKVACIYADAPVCDIRSWPGGKFEGTGNASDWPKCLKAYDITEAEAMNFDRNPFDNLETLAAARVPVLQVCGTADTAVPLAENGAIFEERYAKLGGPITTIRKEGVGHHPHSLENPVPITDFVLKHTMGPNPYAQLRNGLGNSLHTFRTTKKGRVAFLGGSITEMKGWRDHVCAYLEDRFPDTEFDFVHAGISSTDSTLAAFRLEHDVFARGPVDLLFMEHAVNDNHNSRSSADRVHGVEGVIRHARTLNPNIDIVIQYFVEPAKMELFNAGKPDPIIVDHERVAQHYGVTAHNLARLVTDAINRGDFTWEQFRDLHPSPFGHEVYMDGIENLLEAAWEGSGSAKPHALPEQLSPYSYVRGRYADIRDANTDERWNYIENWMPSDGAGKRKQFINVPVLEARTPGATLTLEFTGSAVGILVTAGPDAGIIEYRIDDGPAQTLDQFTQWSSGLHIPWAYMLATELTNEQHTLTLKLTANKNEKAAASTIRIHRFLVN